MYGTTPRKLAAGLPKKLMVWVDVSPFAFEGYFQVPAVSFRRCNFHGIYTNSAWFRLVNAPPKNSGDPFFLVEEMGGWKSIENNPKNGEKWAVINQLTSHFCLAPTFLKSFKDPWHHFLIH